MSQTMTLLMFPSQQAGKQMIPRLSSVAVLRDATQFSGVGQMASIQSAAAPLGIELTPINVRDAEEIKRGLTAFARAPNVGLIVTAYQRSSPGRLGGVICRFPRA
jgi:hypothetical protein